MDLEIILTVRRRMAKKTSEELLDIYKRRPEKYSKEAFEAIRQILVERGVKSDSIDLTPPEGSEQLANEI